MKKVALIFLAVVMVFTLCIGTAFAKKSGLPGSDNKGKSTAQQQTTNGQDKQVLPKGQLKQELKNSFKAAVTPYLNTIKANRRAWGQAGGFEELAGIGSGIEGALEKLIAGMIPVTPEQLAAIKAEIGKIKTYKEALKTDKSAITSAWRSYIQAKKTYAIEEAVGALQKIIDLQKTRIDARKGIFASMANIFNILKEALQNPPAVPSPAPSPEPSPTPSPEPSPSGSAA